MTLKSNNRRMVLSFLRSGEIVSINNISDETGISRTTVKKIVEYFISNDLVVFAGKGQSTDGGGKKPDLFQLNREYGYIISICITLNDIFSTVTDLYNTMMFSDSFSIKTNETLDTVLSHIQHIYTRYTSMTQLKGKRLIGVVLGYPGVMDVENGIGIIAPNFLSWGVNVDMRGRLDKVIQEKDLVYIENVNRLQALAEKQYGIASEKERFIIIDIGHGCGGGIYDQGTLLHGANHLSGEVGHMVVNPFSNRKCVCGATGCLESMIKVERLVSNAMEGYPNHPESLLFEAASQNQLNADMIFQASEHGDVFARMLLDDIIRWLSIAIVNIYVIYDPEMVVIQGIYARAGGYFLDKLRQETELLVFTNIKKHIEIQYSSLGVEREVLGGSSLVLKKFFENPKGF